MKIKLQSFGRKYGVPEAEIVLDVRCLENPFWVSELKPLSGLDAPVKDYIFSNAASLDFAQKAAELLRSYASLSEARNCEEVCFAIGCTGGRHRSVAVTEFLAKALENYEVEIDHRDIGRG